VKAASIAPRVSVQAAYSAESKSMRHGTKSLSNTGSSSASSKRQAAQDALLGSRQIAPISVNVSIGASSPRRSVEPQSRQSCSVPYSSSSRFKRYRVYACLYFIGIKPDRRMWVTTAHTSLTLDHLLTCASDTWCSIPWSRSRTARSARYPTKVTIGTLELMDSNHA